MRGQHLAARRRRIEPMLRRVLAVFLAVILCLVGIPVSAATSGDTEPPALDVSGLAVSAK